MLSDGHCLYRAVADQLAYVGRPIATSPAHQTLRIMCSNELKGNAGDYMPYLPEVSNEEQYIQYCDRVKSTAEWGGQIELKALVSALRIPITVYSAGSPPIVMGEDFGGDLMLRITYHLKYYALGEHYNSTVKA